MSPELTRKPEAFQVSFMPWAGIEKEIKLGPVTFWPFSTQASERVGDKAIREHLERNFRCYVDHKGNPINTVTVCSHGLSDFRQLSPVEADETRAAVDALIFSIVCRATNATVCANNKSMGPPSAERYQLITQNFRPGEDDIAVRAGSVLSGGWKIGEIFFPMPWSTGGAFASPDSRVLEAFSKTPESGFLVEGKERLFRSLEWFRLAHVESDDVSVLSKVVMMATAFEIVLGVPNVRDKSGWVADEVAGRCSEPESLPETRKGKKGKDQTRPKIGWWAWDFYKLRNAIVHGDTIQQGQLRFQSIERTWLTHLIVADLVLRELVMRELYRYGCVGENIRKCAAECDKILPGTAESRHASWCLGFDDVHRALGWLPERTSSRRGQA